MCSWMRIYLQHFSEHTWTQARKDWRVSGAPINFAGSRNGKILLLENRDSIETGVKIDTLMAFKPKDLINVEDLAKATSALKQNVWQWDENSSRRFSLYVDLLRSMDSESLVKWYSEVKPLIDEAYSELGYEDNFTNTLQDAITRVLDMELPKSSMDLIHPSVMYKFADPELEALPDTDKLLLRIGKENLLVMKSILLELHERLAQQANGVN